MLYSNLIIVSGGQTGVDRAALDVAIKRGITYRGWCPAGRWAEDGIIHERYHLRMTPSKNPAQRTVWNVRESNGLLMIGSLDSSSGATLAYQTAQKDHIPIVHIQTNNEIASVIKWLETLDFPIVNIAGPRESEEPGIYLKSFHFLDKLTHAIRSDYHSS